LDLDQVDLDRAAFKFGFVGKFRRCRQSPGSTCDILPSMCDSLSHSQSLGAMIESLFSETYKAFGLAIVLQYRSADDSSKRAQAIKADSDRL
jgi:hypothetical protein